VAAKSHYAPIDRVDQRITQLHRQLKITTAEDPQWQEFTAVMRMNATAANQAYTDRSKQLGTMTAVDDMKSYSDLTMMHAENMQKLTTAFEKLYAALSPEQQKTADTLFRGAAARHKG
jgi:protein CpxP